MSKGYEQTMRLGFEAQRKAWKRARREDLLMCYLTAISIIFAVWMFISFIDVNIHNMSGNQTYQFLSWNMFRFINHPSIAAWMYAGY